MPRVGRNFEKSKDFKGSMKRLLSNLRPWRVMLFIALALAMISAILALISPNKLSDLADMITDGLTPQITEKTIMEIMTDPSISNEDKATLQSLMTSSSEDTDEILVKLDELPKPIYEKIKPQMDIAKIKRLSFILAIIYIVSALMSFIQSLILSTISNYH